MSWYLVEKYCDIQFFPHISQPYPVSNIKKDKHGSLLVEGGVKRVQTTVFTGCSVLPVNSILTLTNEIGRAASLNLTL